jgi:Ni,Fe-hydrogenase I large subunit
MAEPTPTAVPTTSATPTSSAAATPSLIATPTASATSTATAAPAASTGKGRKVVIDPVTRIEGHLRVTCVVENGKVTDAWNTATQFRGFEIFMKNRNPRDCWQFAQRICGVCPTPHAHASVLATEHALAGADFKVPDGARLFRNMSEAAHIGYDHILWFYILNALDYVNVPNALKAKVPGTQPALKAVQDQVKAVVDSGQLGPFAGHWWDHPAYKNSPELDLELVAHYLQAIEAQQFANDASAYMGGRFPMVMNYQVGGMINQPTIEEVQYYKGQMDRVSTFIDTVMVPDLLSLAPIYIDLAGIGAGHKNYLSWGIMDAESQDPYDRLLPRGAIFDGDLTTVQKPDIDKDVKIFTKNSYYSDSSGQGKHPLDAGQDVQFTAYPDLKGDALPSGKYDWTQSARLGADNRPMEVGPLAEILVAYAAGRPEVKALVDSTLAAVGAAGKPEILMSDLGRIAGRVLRAKLNSDFAQSWADDYLALLGKGTAQVYRDPGNSTDGEGSGGWNAPRGALAHYVRVKGGKTSAYAAVPPTNWNLAPRDDNGVRGPLEQTLIGTPVVDPTKPLEILRVVHTFDP